MNDVAAQAIELRLLTHRPAEMTEWWAALLGGAPQSMNARMTAIHGDSLRVVIERSPIALDYHAEASGVPTLRAHALHSQIDMHQAYGLTSVIATHNPRLAAACDRVLRLENGRLTARDGL